MLNIFKKTNVFFGKGGCSRSNIAPIFTRKLREKLTFVSDLEIRAQLIPQFTQLESFLPDVDVAIFTYKSASVDKHRLTLFKIPQAIVFDEEKDLKADMIFVLSSPSGQIGESLSLLSSLSRLLRMNNIAEKLRGADTQDAVRAVLWEEQEARRAA